jgi:hypothetical protein
MVLLLLGTSLRALVNGLLREELGTYYAHILQAKKLQLPMMSVVIAGWKLNALWPDPKHDKSPKQHNPHETILLLRNLTIFFDILDPLNVSHMPIFAPLPKTNL